MVVVVMVVVMVVCAADATLRDGHPGSSGRSAGHLRVLCRVRQPQVSHRGFRLLMLVMSAW